MDRRTRKRVREAKKKARPGKCMEVAMTVLYVYFSSFNVSNNNRLLKLKYVQSILLLPVE